MVEKKYKENIDKENTHKEFSERIEIHNIENQTIIKPSITTSILTQKDKENIELIFKKIMIEQKTTLPSLRNQELKKVNIETEELNQ